MSFADQLEEASGKRWPKSHLDRIEQSLVGFKLMHRGATADDVQKHAKKIVVSDLRGLAKMRRDDWAKRSQGHLDRVKASDPGPSASGAQRSTYEKRLKDAEKRLKKVEAEARKFEAIAKRVEREGVPEQVLSKFVSDMKARPAYWSRR